MRPSLTRERVRDAIGDSWRFERGTGELDQASHVAVLAHWSVRSTPTRSFCALTQGLQSRGYRVVVSSSCDSPRAIDWPEWVDRQQLIVIRKPNLGYDFGSWSIAMSAIPEIAGAERVILANDSMIGPLRPLDPLLGEFDATGADVWGLTDTYQFGYHLQSYFLGFAGGILDDAPLRRFWANVCHERTKQDVIHRNEVGLGRLLWEEGYIQAAAYPFEGIVEAGQNPVIVGWRQLLERGFPFVKREILRDPTVAPGGSRAAAIVRRVTGCELEAWVEPSAP